MTDVCTTISNVADAEKSTATVPVVTVVMPIRNEARFIENSLKSILAQDYPADRYEVIVADGMSDDGTREILRDLQREYKQIRVIDNPCRIVSTGLNAAIKQALGDIVIRIDGHTLVASDFLRQNVSLLEEHPEAWSVGGPMEHDARSHFGKAVVIAMSHPLGVGNARHHFLDYEGYADGASFPAIRRWVFNRVGNFDEKLVRNQDDEFNFRMTQAGGKIFISPRVRSKYFVREKLGQLFRQYFQYGFWRIPVVTKHRRPTTIRQIVPLLFYLAVIALAVIGLWTQQALIAIVLPLIYLAALYGVAATFLPQVGFSVAWRIPLAISVMHLAYALGMLYGAWSACLRRSPSDHHERMATLSR